MDYFFIGTVGSFFGRNCGWVANLSYFWLEMWGSGAGKCEGSRKILVDLPF